MDERANPAERDWKIKALHDEISEAVLALVADPAWRAMLDTAAKFHGYSLANQLSIHWHADRQGFTPTRVAGFRTWKSLGRRVRKSSKGLPILAPCTYRATAEDTGGDGQDQPGTDADTAAGQTPARVLRGFRVAYVFDVSQTDGAPVPDVRPELLTGDAPAALWDALAAQIAAAGYRITRGRCLFGANGTTEALTRTVTVRADVDDAQAAKTLAHELAHIACGHLDGGYDYRGCRGVAEAEAESVAYIVTAWAGLDSAAYTVPYVARWSGGDPAVVHGSAKTVTAVARQVIDGIEAYARAAAGDTAPADSTPPTHLAGVLVGAERSQP